MQLCLYAIVSFIPRLPQFFRVTRRERREPGKLYHVRDVGVEATWSAACARPIYLNSSSLLSLCVTLKIEGAWGRGYAIVACLTLYMYLRPGSAHTGQGWLV